jgi:hypothetical protein
MSVTNINEARIQREIDERQLKAIDSQIGQMEQLMVYLLHQRRELVNRLGLNKPTGPEAA